MEVKETWSLTFLVKSDWLIRHLGFSVMFRKECRLIAICFYYEHFVPTSELHLHQPEKMSLCHRITDSYHWEQVNETELQCAGTTHIHRCVTLQKQSKKPRRRLHCHSQPCSCCVSPFPNKRKIVAIFKGCEVFEISAYKIRKPSFQEANFPEEPTRGSLKGANVQ